MSKKRYLPWILAVAIIIISVLIAVWVKDILNDLFVTHEYNKKNRYALINLYTEINPGDTQEKVLQKYDAIRTEDLRLNSGNPTFWIIGMPMELGASDWDLQLEYEGEIVTAVRVRTLDGPKPDGSPDDKIMPSESIDSNKTQ